MKASQWTNASGGLEKNLKVNNNASLPKAANSLGKDETLVKVSYSALNPVDYKMAEMPLLGQFGISKPASPCLDYSGKVVATTRSDLKLGQSVFGKLDPPKFGAMAEYLVADREGCVALPEGATLKDAGSVGVAGLTAYQCVAPNVKAGDKVLINGGSGGTGTFGIQIAKALGCYVVTTCSGPNVDLCKSVGADEVIDYKTQDVVETLKRGGRQFDLIIDNVGTQPEIYWQCHHYLKPTAKYVTVGMTINLWAVYNMLSIFLIPSFLGGGQRKYEFLTANSKAVDYAAIGKLLAEGKVKPVIEETFTLDTVPEAFQKLKTGRVRGKLMVKISDE